MDLDCDIQLKAYAKALGARWGLGTSRRKFWQTHSIAYLHHTVPRHAAQSEVTKSSTDAHLQSPANPGHRKIA